jgi:hypothetical protein
MPETITNNETKLSANCPKSLATQSGFNFSRTLRTNRGMKVNTRSAILRYCFYERTDKAFNNGPETATTGNIRTVSDIVRPGVVNLPALMATPGNPRPLQMNWHCIVSDELSGSEDTKLT